MRNSMVALMLCASILSADAGARVSKAADQHLCSDIVVHGLGANAARSLAENDFRVYTSGNVFTNRGVPGIKCFKDDMDKLISRGHMFSSDNYHLCTTAEFNKGVAMSAELLKYNRAMASSPAFQAATNCFPG